MMYLAVFLYLMGVINMALTLLDEEPLQFHVFSFFVVFWPLIPIIWAVLTIQDKLKR